VKYVLEGQQSFFDNIEVIEEPKPVKSKPKKPRKPRAPEFPFECNIWNRYVIVYAQHERQAYAKCKRMYGCCIGTPDKKV
jgi:hypothetical protein